MGKLEPFVEVGVVHKVEEVVLVLRTFDKESHKMTMQIFAIYKAICKQ